MFSRRFNTATAESLTPPAVAIGNASALALDADWLYTRVYANDILLGEQIADLCFPIPESLRDETVHLKIERYTSVAPLLGRVSDTVPQTNDTKQTSLTRWFPKNQLDCGVRGLRLLK